MGAGGPPVGSGPGSVASRAPSVDRSMDRSFDRGSVGPGVGYTPRRRGSSASSVGRMSTGGSVSTPLRRANLAEASRMQRQAHYAEHMQKHKTIAGEANK